MMGSGRRGGSVIPVPDAAFSWLPFSISLIGGVYVVDPAWSMQTQANITVAKTYYVDFGTGLDTNTGLSWAAAYKTLTKALSKSDVDRVYIRNGEYPYSAIAPTTTRNVEIIGDGTAVISASLDDILSAWSSVDNHYEATHSASFVVDRVIDESLDDGYGHYTAYVRAADLAECDATPGSYYPTAGTIYVRTFDDRAPDADIRCMNSVNLNFTANNQVYCKDLTFYGGLVRHRNTTGATLGGAAMFLEGCTLLNTSGLSFLGGDYYLRDCTVHSFGDGINYDARNSVIARGVEINCDITNLAGGNAADSQASTLHNASVAVRISSDYHDCSGQLIADVTGSLSWILGCTLDNSTVADVGLYIDGTAWVDGCEITNVSEDLVTAGAGDAIYYRNLTSGGNFTANGGTIAAY